MPKQAAAVVVAAALVVQSVLYFPDKWTKLSVQIGSLLSMVIEI